MSSKKTSWKLSSTNQKLAGDNRATETIEHAAAVQHVRQIEETQQHQSIMMLWSGS